MGKLRPAMILFFIIISSLLISENVEPLGYIESILNSDPQEALRLSRMNLTQALAAKDKRLELAARKLIGTCLKNKGDLVGAETMWHSALKLSESMKRDKDSGLLKLWLGDIELVSRRTEAALLLYKEASDAFTRSRNANLVFEARIREGEAYYVEMEYQGAIRLIQTIVFNPANDIPKPLFARANHILGKCNEALGMHRSSLGFYRKALEYYRASRDSLVLGEILTDTGRAFYESGNYDQALEMYFAAIPVLQNDKIKSDLARVYDLISAVYHKLNRDNEAISFLQKAQMINISTQNMEQLADNYLNLGRIYQGMNQNAASIMYFGKAEAIYKETVLTESLTRAQNLLANAHLDAGNKDKALATIQKALQNAARSRSDALKPSLLITLAEIHLAGGELSSALPVLENALLYARKTGARQEMVTIFRDISEVHEKLGSPQQAISYYKRYETLKDSLQNEYSDLKIAEIQSLYETYEKEKEIERLRSSLSIERVNAENEKLLLNNQLAVQSLRTYNQKVFLILSLSLAIVLVSFAAFISARYRRERLLREKLNSQNIRLEEAYRQLNAAQQERIELEKLKSAMAISVTMNHEINQPLMTMQGNLEMLLEIMEPQVHQKYERYFIRMIESINRVKNILDSIERLDRVSFTNYAGGSDMISLKTASATADEPTDDPFDADEELTEEELARFRQE